jgi:hypothetical protein
MRLQVVPQHGKDNITVGVHNRVETKVKPGSLREALTRSKEHARTFRIGNASDDTSLPKHNPMRVIIGKAKQIGIVIYRGSLSA